MMYKYGLTLSGGGARGFAHIGVIRAMEELGIHADIVSGTSAGAIVGVFYALGKDSYEIEEILEDTSFFDLRNFNFGKSSLFKLNSLENTILQIIPENDFAILKKPLFISAANISNGSGVYFNSGELSTAICASAAIPGIFQPVKINGDYYVDGAVTDNFPVEAIRDQCKHIIGVNVNRIDPIEQKPDFTDILDRSIHLIIQKDVLKKKSLCDYFINPKGILKYPILSARNRKALVKLGYEEAMEILK